ASALQHPERFAKLGQRGHRPVSVGTPSLCRLSRALVKHLLFRRGDGVVGVVARGLAAEEPPLEEGQVALVAGVVPPPPRLRFFLISPSVPYHFSAPIDLSSSMASSRVTGSILVRSTS